MCFGFFASTHAVIIMFFLKYRSSMVITYVGMGDYWHYNLENTTQYQSYKLSEKKEYAISLILHLTCVHKMAKTYFNRWISFLMLIPPFLHHFAGFKILISAKQITNNLPICGFNVILSPFLSKFKMKLVFSWALPTHLKGGGILAIWLC